MTGTITQLPRPIRIYDSRNPGLYTGHATPTDGPISAGQDRQIEVDPPLLAPSGSPDDVTFGVFLTVTVDQTKGAGFLSMPNQLDYPTQDNGMGWSLINWSGDGQILANTTLIVAPFSVHSTFLEVVCGGSGSTQFILDVLATVH